MTFRKSFALLTLALLLPACSTNEATGRSQFTGLMNSASESRLGVEEQQKAQSQFGVVEDQALQAYVDRICAKLLPGVERTDVNYTCTVLDSPVINAFALPGGYININRGILAFANSEAEVAAVLAHEMGHVTARHISERYTQSALTQLGATALSIGLGSQSANQLIGMGANMYLASYTRGQESEADDLGIRYLNRAGYDPAAMTTFLAALQRSAQLEALEQGEDYKEMKNFMATHPLTSERIAQSANAVAMIPTKGTTEGVDAHLRAVNGLVYGDSPKDGFVRGGEFVHPGLGFAFMVPQGFKYQNQPDKVVVQSKSGSGAAYIFDMAEKPYGMDLATYIQQGWTQGKAKLDGQQTMDVNGMKAATAQTQGTLNGRAVLMRLVAIEWSPNQVARFQFAMPQNTTPKEIDAFKSVSYSLRRISDAERNMIQPKRIAVVTAGSGDTVASLTRRMAFDDGLNDQRFRALNAMGPNDTVVAGRKYKIVVD
ncbi:MAG: M48 family metalloprotease [Alphaproteobacteria bacterium]|nr:M48 family metalloprotease [Alphaproteobacteria bacterium]